MRTPEPVWPWRPEDFTPSPARTSTTPFDGEHLPQLAARCFRGADGDVLLAYLKAMTLDRALGPDAADATLRHLEGQRHLVRHLSQLIDQGRHGPDHSPMPKGTDA